MDHECQGSLVCCSSWGHKQSDITEQPNSNKNLHFRKLSKKDNLFSSFMIHVVKG